MSGTLIVQPIQAQLTRDLDTFSKMDPYWIITLGSKVAKGKTCKSGGKNPHWDDSITLTLSGEPEFYVELKDKDILKDDTIGVCQVPIKDVTAQPKTTNWYTLYHKQKSAGQILLEVTFHSSGGQAKPADVHAGGYPSQGGYPTQPQYGAPSGGYPQQPSYGQPSGGYPGGGYPQPGYPQPSGGYGQPQPQGGYPGGGYPQQPSGGHSQGGYPGGPGGYPVGGHGGPGYPGGHGAPGHPGGHGGPGYPGGHGGPGFSGGHGGHGYPGDVKLGKDGKPKKHKKEKKEKKDKKNKHKGHSSSSSSSDSD